MQIVKDLIVRYPALAPCSDSVQETVSLLKGMYEAGGKLLLCGNGGSAADCEHIVGELMKGFVKPRPLSPAEKDALLKAGGSPHLADSLQQGLPAMSLCGHPALASAFINDVDASLLYAQQVWGLGKTGDILLGISTSGNAENVYNAAIAARAKGMRVIGLTGAAPSRLSAVCDCCIRVPASETYQVQEYHLPIYHAICLALEAAFY